jgi:hypothetical protein
MSPVLTPGSIASGPVKNVIWFQVTALMTSKVQHMELTDKMILVSDTQLFFTMTNCEHFFKLHKLLNTYRVQTMLARLDVSPDKFNEFEDQ